jgi:hypothetical protein
VTLKLTTAFNGLITQAVLLPIALVKKGLDSQDILFVRKTWSGTETETNVFEMAAKLK